MARQPKPAPDASADGIINTKVDGALRSAIDAYIADHNEKNEHPAGLRSTVEAALKAYLREKGFWPPKRN